MIAQTRRIPAQEHKTDHSIYSPPGDVYPWDIRFDPTNRADLDYLGEDYLGLEFTGRGKWLARVVTEPGLSEARLVVRDPTGEVLSYPGQVIAETERFLWWEVLTQRLTPGSEYSWAFRNPEGAGVYFSPTGVSGSIERLDRWTLPDQYPLTIPGWVQGSTIYQIFPDRFANGDPSNEPPEVEQWDAPPTQLGFWGGDLPGITAKLDYLQGLGVNLIYLNPIFVSPSNHRYDTSDYYRVDPMLGGNEALRELVAAAHGRQIGVMLDVSINHCHPRFEPFADLLQRGRESRYRDWFVVKDWPPRVKYRPHLDQPDWVRQSMQNFTEQTGVEVETLDGPGLVVEPTYESWYGVPSMPRINLAHIPAREYFKEVLAFWVKEYDIDGWRMDVARYIDRDIWPEVRARLRLINPDVYLLAEVFGDTSYLLQGDGFDATMNYTFRDLALGFFATEQLDGPRMMEGMARLWAQHPVDVSLANQNLLGSHDTPRFLDMADNQLWRLQLATIFQLTYPGSPGLYYGDEVGMTGSGNDPGCRGTFPWSEVDLDRNTLIQTIREIQQIRERDRTLIWGDWRGGWASHDAILFGRQRDRDLIGVAFNRGEEPVEIPLSSSQIEFLWGKAEQIEKSIRVSGRSAAIFHIN